MQTLKRRSSPCKYKNDPSRFLGEGITFKAKLIGILEVNEARGDKMCQDALNDLKTAIRAAGEHKQRITINISIDGLRLRDEKTGDCLYHHPVHKISFIAQDMSDSRAFGYIFGSPDTGHRFFGIKTDKTASQVVISMRDLFQVVFELKKKEIEMAKHHSEQSHFKYGSTAYMDSIHLSKDDSSTDKSKGKYSQTVKSKCSTSKTGETSSADMKTNSASEAIADLLDLEQGINQMNKITCSDPFGPLSKTDPYDPFDDSFSCTVSNVTDKRYAASGVSTERSSEDPIDVHDHSFFVPTATTSKTHFFSQFSPRKSGPDEGKWFTKEPRSLFDESSNGNALDAASPPATNADFEQVVETKRSPIKTDLFTELDPLGTGRVKPYVDKKDFFQDLKNPPKKVLKELITDGTAADISSHYFPAQFSESRNAPEGKPDTFGAGPDFIQEPNSNSGFSKVDPFTEGDPFEKTDPFKEENFPVSVEFPSFFTAKSSLDAAFEEKTPWKNEKVAGSQEERQLKAQSSANFSVFSSSVLRVSLPPENALTDKFKSPSNSPDSKAVMRNTNSIVRQRTESERGEESLIVEEPFIKCQLTSVEKKLEAARMSPFKGKLYSGRSPPAGRMDSMESRTSGSVEMLDATTPDPPPRAKTTLFTIKPPPLPPKKAGYSGMKPPARPPSLEDSLPHYDYLHQKEPVANGFKAQEGVKCMKLNKEIFTTKDSNRYFDEQKADLDRKFPVLLPPPHRKASADAGAKPTTSKKLIENANKISSGNGSVLDIKLTQLDSTGLENLAATLGIPSENVYSMTLQDLTKMLAEKYLKSSKDESETSVNGSFEVDFDSNFAKPETISQTTTYDKYAAFKELMETENLKSGNETKILTVNSSMSVGDENEFDVAAGMEKATECEEDKYEALRQLSLNTEKVNDFSEGKSTENVSSFDLKPEEAEEDEAKKSEGVIGPLRPASDLEDNSWGTRTDWTKVSASSNSPAMTNLFPVTDQFLDEKKAEPIRDNWATFDKTNLSETNKTKSDENFNEDENSPFSSDGKDEERDVEFQWDKSSFKKRNGKDLPWRDDDESWDDYSPKESMCSDDSSRDERSPERHRGEKTSWSARRRPLVRERPRSEKTDQWSFRNRWQEETEDEFEETWRKHRERTGSCDSDKRAYWHGDSRDDFKKRCDQCGVWGDDWGGTTRHPLCSANRRKRSESDNEYRKRCDSDASDKECIWTFRPESQTRTGKQKQYHSLARFSRECSGHCHDSRAKQKRSIGQKRLDAASESKRSYEMFYPEDHPGKRNTDEFCRRSHPWKEGKYRTDPDRECQRNRTRKGAGRRSKSGGGFDSSTEGDTFVKGKETSESKVNAGEPFGRKGLRFDNEGDNSEKQKTRGIRPSPSKSPEPRPTRWATTNGKSEADTFSPSLPSTRAGFQDFSEPLMPSSKRPDAKPEMEAVKGSRQESVSLLRKSDSINIFSRDKDPFEGDDFFNS